MFLFKKNDIFSTIQKRTLVLKDRLDEILNEIEGLRYEKVFKYVGYCVRGSQQASIGQTGSSGGVPDGARSLRTENRTSSGPPCVKRRRSCTVLVMTTRIFCHKTQLKFLFNLDKYQHPFPPSRILRVSNFVFKQNSRVGANGASLKSKLNLPCRMVN